MIFTVHESFYELLASYFSCISVERESYRKITSLYLKYVVHLPHTSSHKPIVICNDVTCVTDSIIWVACAQTQTDKRKPFSEHVLIERAVVICKKRNI